MGRVAIDVWACVGLVTSPPGEVGLSSWVWYSVTSEKQAPLLFRGLYRLAGVEAGGLISYWPISKLRYLS